MEAAVRWWPAYPDSVWNWMYCVVPSHDNDRDGLGRASLYTSGPRQNFSLNRRLLGGLGLFVELHWHFTTGLRSYVLLTGW